MHILWANRQKGDCAGGQSDSLQTPPPGRSWGWRCVLGLGKPAPSQDTVKHVENQGIIVKELEALKHQSHAHNGLSVEYFVDEEKSFIQPANIARHLKVYTQKDGAPPKGSRVILVSGPDGFIQHWAGRKTWVAGREAQGPLGGVLSQMDLRGWKVYKL